jgi:hypothetical protein
VSDDGGRDEGPLGFGAEPEEDRWAHRQDPDLVAEGVRGPAPSREDIPVPRPPGASRYGWFLGVVGVLLLGLVLLNGARSHGPGSRGVQVGARMPAFAAPLALGTLTGDVNVATKAGQGDAGSVPACAVRRTDVLNVCRLWERGPVVLAFFATRGAECTRELDALEAVRRRHPGVQFAAVSIRGNRDDVRRLVRRHAWRFPVGYDSDGITANLYGVAVCPQVTYALPGGRVTGTSLGELGPREIDARVRALERTARARGWRPTA